MLRAAVGGGEASPLWPSDLRVAPRPTAPAPPVSARATPVANTWHAPDPSPVAWRRTAGGLEWIARDGGAADSVVFAAVLSPSEPRPTTRQVAELELLARSWSMIRLPSGARIDSALAAHGARTNVRSVPYPTLATSDEFLMLGVPDTPLGVYGLELTVTAPRAYAPLVLSMVRQALASGVIDSVPFDQLHRRQLALLRSLVGSVDPSVRVAERRRMLVPPAGAAARFMPDQISAQGATMESVSLRDVLRSARDLISTGAGRVVILGADEATAREWLDAAGLGRLRSLHWSGVAECPPADTATVTVAVSEPPGATRTRAKLYALRCYSAAHTSTNDAADTLALAAIGGVEEALLAHRLRADLGLAYGMKSRLLPVLDSPIAIWELDIDTPAASVDRAALEIRSTLASVARWEPPAPLLKTIREAKAASLRASAARGVPLATSVLWRGRTPDDEASLVERVTADDIRASLRRIWPTGDILTVRSSTPP